MKINKNFIYTQLFLLFILHIIPILCIYDNYASNTLEEGDYELLDVSDRYSLKLIVSSSRNIYTGIPPLKLSTTEAELINATSLLTINQNYLLEACLNDSLLTKIKLNDGSFSSLFDYTDIDPELNLSIPITSCSISFIDNIVFIGYSEINYYPDEINKTNIIFKINILNKDSEDGPDLDINSEIKFFIFTNSTQKTDSTRQISCSKNSK